MADAEMREDPFQRTAKQLALHRAYVEADRDPAVLKDCEAYRKA